VSDTVWQPASDASAATIDSHSRSRNMT